MIKFALVLLLTFTMNVHFAHAQKNAIKDKGVVYTYPHPLPTEGTPYSNLRAYCTEPAKTNIINWCARKTFNQGCVPSVEINGVSCVIPSCSYAGCGTH